jgi:serine/threonine protein kinase
VYEVTDGQSPGDPTPYALKELRADAPKEAHRRFVREIEALKRLSDPGIIGIIDHSAFEDRYQFLVMEKPPGARPLRDVIFGTPNPFHGDAMASLDLIAKILSALKGCESERITHRDLSPNNILFLPDGSIKIIDFGICQIQEGQMITLTDEGFGTRDYTAPECESGQEGAIGTHSDLYSVGKILWSAVTSRRAFAFERAGFTTLSMKELFPKRPEIWHLHNLFEKTIRSAPENRHQTSDAALWTVERVRFLIEGRYPPLELLASKRWCPVCGVGELQQFSEDQYVFGNRDNRRPIIALQCSRCGHCLAFNPQVLDAEIEGRARLETR